jgi:hypothetical protein
LTLKVGILDEHPFLQREEVIDGLARSGPGPCSLQGSTDTVRMGGTVELPEFLAQSGAELRTTGPKNGLESFLDAPFNV